MSTLFSTTDIEPKYQKSYWVETICKSLMHLDISIKQNGPFYGKIKSDHLAYIQLSKVAADKSTVFRSHRQIARANNQLIHLLFQQNGKTTLKQDGRTAQIRPGQWALCDTTRPSEFTLHDNGCETLVLQLDRSKIRAKLGNLNLMTARSITTSHGLGKVAANYIHSIYNELNHFDDQTSTTIADTIIDLLCTNLQKAIPTKENIVHSHSVTLLEIKDFIQTHLHDSSLTISTIASGLNLSKRYIHLLFQKEDISVSRYIWDLRLARCKKDLSNPMHLDRSITDVALSWGFKSSGHFSGLFKKKFGMSPSAHRKHMLQS